MHGFDFSKTRAPLLSDWALWASSSDSDSGRAPCRRAREVVLVRRRSGELNLAASSQTGSGTLALATIPACRVNRTSRKRDL